MTDYNQLALNNVPSEQDIANARANMQAEKAKLAARPPNVSGRTGSSMSVQMGADGQLSVRHNKPQAVRVSVRDPNMVDTPWGSQTTRQNAINLGWLDANTGAWIGPGSQQPARSVPPAPVGSQESNTQQQQQQQGASDNTEAMKATEELITKADELLGPQVVSKTLHEGAITGDVEAAATAVGYDASQAQQVVQGFTDYANRVLAPIRSNVNVLMATMNESELAQAQHAVVTGNTSKLQAFGKEAQKRLATLPEKNPEGFRQLIDTHFPEVAFRRGSNGEVLVLLDGEDNWTSWSNAVLMGEVTF